MAQRRTITKNPGFAADVVYQVYPRSFNDSNGDGVGDIPGVTEKLDYLHHLGVDVVWLSPVYSSPQRDNGYDISDYYSIDPTFGTLADLDLLIEGLHRRGMKLVMDLVVNHTSDQHPWFLESRSSKDNPKRDWYWWRDPGPDGGEPNNWGAVFSGPAWTLDPTTDQYYLQLFSPQQPDLNWENPEVRQAIYEMMNWWLDRGVDGFRMDVINFISKNPELPSGEVHADSKYGDGGASFVSGPRIHEFLQEMHREVIQGQSGPVLTIGEMPGVTLEDAQLYTDQNRKELDMVFQFEHVQLDHNGSKWNKLPFDLAPLKESLSRWQEGLAERGWNSLYWGNHDQPRAVSRFGNDEEFRVVSAKLLAGILHLHRGTPFIYQGEELGMTNMVFEEVEDYRDIEAINHYLEAVSEPGASVEEVLSHMAPLNRDNARTPIQWDGSKEAGFTSGEPWISVNPNYKQINAEAELADPDSVFNFYRQLIELRHTDPVVSLGSFAVVDAGDPNVYAYRRDFEGDTLLVIGNFSSQTVSVAHQGLQLSAANPRILGNYPQSTDSQLLPWELRVHRSMDL